MRRITIDQASFDAYGLDGSICLACGDHDPHDTQCEPDAEHYLCSQCDRHMRFGVAEAFMAGHVEVSL